MTKQNKINISELLKNCPSRMELNCTMYEDVYFDYVDELNIIHCYIQHETHKTSLTFNQHGTPNSDIKSKCVIFPKGKTTWEGFKPSYKFKDGDIVATMSGCWIGITEGGESNDFIPTYCVIKGDGKFEAYFNKKKLWSFSRFATEEEKEKLFNAIKDNGYEWNLETKTLEKLVQPTFKIGDKVYNIVHNENQIITKLSWDSQENEFVYQTNNNEYVYANYLQLYKEETMDKANKAVFDVKAQCCNIMNHLIKEETIDYVQNYLITKIK